MQNKPDIFNIAALHQIPHVSGIYCVYAGDTCLYVGQSSNLYKRLISHNHKEAFITEASHIVIYYVAVGEADVTIRTHLLADFEHMMIDWLCPQFNIRRPKFRSYLMQTQFGEAMKSKLYKLTHKKLMEKAIDRPLSHTLHEIAKDTELNYHWLVSFATNRCGDPSATKLEKLYEHLIGRELELR